MASTAGDAGVPGNSDGTSKSAGTGKCVFLESPYSGDVDRNLRYLMLCGFDAFARGEMAVATHSSMTAHPCALHYFVSDYDKKWDVFSREEAIARGQVLRKRCDNTVFYQDLGWSRGMLSALEFCKANDLPFEIRNLDVDGVLSLRAPLITRELVTAILHGDDYSHLLQPADATVVPAVSR